MDHRRVVHAIAILVDRQAEPATNFLPPNAGDTRSPPGQWHSLFRRFAPGIGGLPTTATQKGSCPIGWMIQRKVDGSSSRYPGHSTDGRWLTYVARRPTASAV